MNTTVSATSRASEAATRFSSCTRPSAPCSRNRRDVPPKVAINEYVEIAHAFYDQGEPTFINSVLDKVARQERAADLAR